MSVGEIQIQALKRITTHPNRSPKADEGGEVAAMLMQLRESSYSQIPICFRMNA
ncbi:MAG: hypothetical protein QOC81_4203 [Thermoanaerobaculia bacterium]|jgi:hypothetical protein|nr:hypothetical protein [Thermoanaerobaculia bacterium]